MHLDLYADYESNPRFKGYSLIDMKQYGILKTSLEDRITEKADIYDNRMSGMISLLGQKLSKKEFSKIEGRLREETSERIMSYYGYSGP